MKAFNGIMSVFNKTISKLEMLVEANNELVNDNTKRIDSLKAKNLDLIAESQAAKNAAANLRKILEANTTEDVK